MLWKILKWAFNLVWPFGRQRLEEEAAERLDHTDKLTDAEKEALKGGLDEALDKAEELAKKELDERATDKD